MFLQDVVCEGKANDANLGNISGPGLNGRDVLQALRNSLRVEVRREVSSTLRGSKTVIL